VIECSGHRLIAPQRPADKNSTDPQEFATNFIRQSLVQKQQKQAKKRETKNVTLN